MGPGGCPATSHGWMHDRRLRRMPLTGDYERSCQRDCPETGDSLRAWTLLGRASRVLSGSRVKSMSDRTAEAWLDLFWPARGRWSLRAMERSRLHVVPGPPGAPAPGEPVSHRADAEPRRHRVRGLDGSGVERLRLRSRRGLLRTGRHRWLGRLRAFRYVASFRRMSASRTATSVR
jgi:hypothetical protein